MSVSRLMRTKRLKLISAGPLTDAAEKKRDTFLAVVSISHFFFFLLSCTLEVGKIPASEVTVQDCTLCTI